VFGRTLSASLREQFAEQTGLGRPKSFSFLDQNTLFSVGQKLFVVPWLVDQILRIRRPKRFILSWPRTFVLASPTPILDRSKLPGFTTPNFLISSDENFRCSSGKTPGVRQTKLPVFVRPNSRCSSGQTPIFVRPNSRCSSDKTSGVRQTKTSGQKLSVVSKLAVVGKLL
jgi:hypothetical protein